MILSGKDAKWLAVGGLLLLMLPGCALCLTLLLPLNNATPSEIAVEISTPAPLFTPTSTPSQTSTPSPAATPSQTPPPTATATLVVSSQPNFTATFRAALAATTQAETNQAVFARINDLAAPAAPLPPAGGQAVSFSATERLALAHYFAWFDGDGWNDCNISAGDQPLQPYSSDDPAAIARHVRQAQGIGLDGFLLHWFVPGGRTDRNFATLLAMSQGSRFASSVVFSRHIWHGGGASRQTIAEALAHIINQYGSHPNFLRVDGKPVIFFTDVYRTPPTGETPQQFWASMRSLVDPQQQTVWIAEGLDPSYLAVFDGLYVFKITHATSPDDYRKSSRWASRVRSWAEQMGQPRLWLATISPGWDDLRSGCRPDVRVDNTLHRLDRAGGSIYTATFNAAVASQPDWLIVGSFNEWVEGSYIEPSVQYGDTYMQMTAEFVRRFKNGQ